MKRNATLVFLLSFILLASCDNNNEEIVPEEPKTSDRDREVLNQIFKLNPSSLLTWDTTEVDLHEWRNLVLDDEGYVIGLNLEGMRLEVLPSQIGQLDRLQQLDIRDNKINSLPEEIGNLTALISFDAGHNNLTVVPAEIKNLIELNFLSLHHNKLTAVPKEIGELTNLRWLYLHNNELTSIPTELGQLTKLESLALHKNKLTSIPQAVCDLIPTLTLSFYLDAGVVCD